jgi:hypothetical protein
MSTMRIAAEEFPGVFAEAEVRVTALLGKRTFWEKATILHTEYHRGPEKPFPARYSRHYYDVAMLSETATKMRRWPTRSPCMAS